METSKQLTKEERIAIRAARVAAKRNKDTDSKYAGAGNKEADLEKVSKSKLQITKSREIVDNTRAEASEMVSNIKLSRDAAESERRRSEESIRNNRMRELELELSESQRINNEIESNWSIVSTKSIPQELYQEIAAQYKAASKLLAKKDERIHKLQQELEKQDKDYVDLLAAHAEDINGISKIMTQQFKRLLETCQTELENVENVFLEERKELLDGHQSLLESLFDRRRRMELQIMEEKQKREKEFLSELSIIRSKDAEEYNAMKIDLENNIQIFEQQLEEMRATYQLNSEKLEYNHQVLLERDAENKATVDHHRSKLRRLKETLSNLITRFHKQDTKYKSENQSLTSEYKRMTEQFKDLQTKFMHFEKVDMNKYQEIWNMNESEVMSYVHKVLRADQIIYQQILGIQWTYADMLLQCQKDKNNSDNNMHSETNVEDITSTMIFNQHVDGQLDSLNRMSSTTTASRGLEKTTTTGSSGNGSTTILNANNTISSTSSTQLKSSETPATSTTTTTTTNTTSTATKGKFTPEQIKKVMDLLVNESTFLLDNRIQETMAILSDENERAMFKADTILSAIGVEDREDLDELVACFYEDPHASDHPSVHPNDVTKVLKDFVIKRQAIKTKTSTTSTSSTGTSSGKLSFHSHKVDSVTTEKKQRKKERERLFWQRLGGVINEETRSVWAALEKAMIKYNGILEERSNLIKETTDLAKQNEELKVLLQEYLGSKINHELQIPPTRVIRVPGS